MNSFRFNKILKETSTTGQLISVLYEKEKRSKGLFNKSLDDLIKENYEALINNKYSDSLPYILNELYARDSLKIFIKERMLYNLTVASSSEFAIIIRNNYGLNWKEYIEENIDILLEKLGCDKVQKIVRRFPDLNNAVMEKINEYLFSKKKKYVEYLLFGKLKEYQDKEDYNNLLEIIVRLVDEVLEHENLSYFNIRKKQSGHYSEVIEIGSKIIKLGKNRRMYEIPYDKRILIPLVRIDLSKFSKIQAVLEVTEKVDCETKISDEELYLIYKDLRERKILCTDMRVENIGILLHENLPYWKHSICMDNINKGIYDTYSDSSLTIGDKVILDLDYIYKENAKKIEWPNIMTKEFEKKYQEEMQDSKVKRIGQLK